MKKYYYERNIIEIKNEYTNFLIHSLINPLYHGINLIYQQTVKTYDKFKNTTHGEKPSIAKIFEIYLKNIEKLNNIEIEKESKRVKIQSGIYEYFDDLLKAVIKSNIVLLTYNVCETTCKLIDQKYHEKINVNDFIHKCYIELVNNIYSNIELVCQEFEKKNNLELNKLIKISISSAIQKMLPLKEILTEYLVNDYIIDVPKPEVIQEKKQIINNLKSYVNVSEIIKQNDNKKSEIKPYVHVSELIKQNNIKQSEIKPVVISNLDTDLGQIHRNINELKQNLN